MKGLLLLLLIAGPLTINAQVLDTVRALSEINVANQADAYPYITNDGLRLYYTNNSSGTNNLYYTSRATLTSSFAAPQLVDNTLFQDIICSWFTEDELEIYFSTGFSLFHTSRTTTASPFGAATQLTLTGNSSVFMSGVSLTPNGEELYIHEDGIGTLKYSYTSPFTYTMESVLNTPAGLEGKPGQLSKDGLAYYWSLSPATTDTNEIYVMSRANVGDSFGASSVMNSLINDGSLGNSQPSYSTGANVLVWTRANANLWDENELYIAFNKAGATADLSNLSENELCLSAFPNPFSSAVTIHFSLDNAETVYFLLTDETGRTVMEFSRDAKVAKNTELIDLMELAEGTYTLTLFNDRFTETRILLKK